VCRGKRYAQIWKYCVPVQTQVDFSTIPPHSVSGPISGAVVNGTLRGSRPVLSRENENDRAGVLSETGRPVVCKTSHPVGKNHFHESKTGRPGVFKGRAESLSDSNTFHTKEQTVNRVAGFRLNPVSGAPP
jgi:hypothetical protein